MRLTLLKPYGLLPAGASMDVDAPVGELLVARGIAARKRGRPPRDKRLRERDTKDKAVKHGGRT
jgi:hypothetical protein